MSGLFISLEGIEGTGKSTQARLLAQALRSRGMDVLLTHEPGGTPISQRIREVLLSTDHSAMDPMAELLLYAAARRQHVAEVIAPALKAGRVVITDRFSDSTVAYQGDARGLDRKAIDALDMMATGGLRPVLTILLDIDAAEGLLRNRGGRTDSLFYLTDSEKVNRLELEDLAFHERVREGYLAVHRADPDRVKLVPAGGSIDEVHKAVLVLVLDFMENE